MAQEPQAWLFSGDARPIVDRAIELCSREHHGESPDELSVKTAIGERADGSTFPFTLVIVEDDHDDWWSSYARFHGWPPASQDVIERAFSS